MQRYSLVVSNEIKGLATKTGVFGFLEVPGANSPRVRLARAERPEAEALAEVRFQATMNSVFPEANVAGVSNDLAEPRRRTCVVDRRSRPFADNPWRIAR
jgi:hypothetical protein